LAEECLGRHREWSKKSRDEMEASGGKRKCGQEEWKGRQKKRVQRGSRQKGQEGGEERRPRQCERWIRIDIRAKQHTVGKFNSARGGGSEVTPEEPPTMRRIGNRSVASFDKDSVSTTVISSDGDGLVEEAVEMLNSDSFVITASSNMNDDVQNRADRLEETFESTAMSSMTMRPQKSLLGSANKQGGGW
jgi:hypothetical protein